MPHAFELETAQNPEALRRIVIEPVSRVEGHGKVTILLDEAHQVHQVRLHIVEFRGFEKFIEGRPYWEVPVLVQRLCGICPVSHHLAASKAMDMIVGATTLTPTAEKIRRLMHYGQMLQSHALHFFHLSSPDLLFGFASDPAKRNIVGVALANPDIAKKGVLLRKFGQEVIRVTAGKRVHGTGSVPGGVNKALTSEERAYLLGDIQQVVAWSQEAVQMIKRLHLQNAILYDGFADVPASMMSLVDANGTLDFYHGALRARDKDGAIIFDQVSYQGYNDLLTEGVKPWSYMKFPFITSLGEEKGWYRVGPLSRVQNCDRMPTPLAEAERLDFLSHGHGTPAHGSLAFHWTRMIEMLCAAETISQLLLDDDLLGQDLLASGPRCQEGIGVIEAPRGSLFHHYRVNEDDLVTYANLIVSTTHNNTPMNLAVRDVAKKYLNGRELTEGLLNHIEVAIRCFDPCLSCATHALGQMPLDVTLMDADGTVLQRMTKDEQGTLRQH
ncbi:MAG TPA: Ni/Fe hydrogenase subunit alpha [Rhodospirillaceae bacterium]|nr:Ni/Fe hydrogenase subunit alpha [Rhodospirillaceae bacterium]